MSRMFVLLLQISCILFCLSACAKTNEDIELSNKPSKSQENTVQTPGMQSKPEDVSNQSVHAHSYSDATCTSAKKCACGATEGEALGHDYSDANCTEPKKCIRCAVESGSAQGHNYVNYICSRCGAQDPEGLPISLHLLPVIDSTYECRYYDQILTDNFGNSYVGYHFFQEAGASPGTVIFYLNSEYAHFSCDVLTLCDTGQEVSFVIYVDDQIVYQSDFFDRTDGKIHVDIDVKNGQQLKISSWNHAGSWGDTIYVVNAQVSKM